MNTKFSLCFCIGFAIALRFSSAYANESSNINIGIKELFTQAWEMQGENKSFDIKKQSLESKFAISQSLFPQSPSLEINSKNESQGNRSLEVAVASPLWLSNQKSSMQKLVASEIDLLNKSVPMNQLKITEDTRQKYWSLAYAQAESNLFYQQLEFSKKLADDAENRWKAGDISKADLHQAKAKLLEMTALYQQSLNKSLQAKQNLRSFSTSTINSILDSSQDISKIELVSEVLPENWELETSKYLEAHPVYQELMQRITFAKNNANMANIQSISNPELRLSMEKKISGDMTSASVVVGVKVPFDLLNTSNKRRQAVEYSGRADILNLEANIVLEKNKLALAIDNAKRNLELSKKQLVLYAQQSDIASQNLGFFAKSFRLGETDLPTLLRIQQQAIEANQAYSKAKLDISVAISNLKQALGLLP